MLHLCAWNYLFLWKYFYFFKGENFILWKSKPELSEAALIFQYVIQGTKKSFQFWGFWSFLWYLALRHETLLGTWSNILHLNLLLRCGFKYWKMNFQKMPIICSTCTGPYLERVLTYHDAEYSSSQWSNSFTLLRGILKLGH